MINKCQLIIIQCTSLYSKALSLIKAFAAVLNKSILLLKINALHHCKASYFIICNFLSHNARCAMVSYHLYSPPRSPLRTAAHASKEHPL